MICSRLPVAYCPACGAKLQNTYKLVRYSTTTGHPLHSCISRCPNKRHPQDKHSDLVSADLYELPNGETELFEG